MFDLSDMKDQLKSLFDEHWRLWAGLAFMAMAMAAIEYDEIIVPRVNRISDAWSSVTADFGRKLSSSLTL